MPFGSFIGSIVGKQMSNKANIAALRAVGAHAVANQLAAQASAQNAQAASANSLGSSGSWATGFSGFGSSSGVANAPHYRDPLEYATETALAQPADKEWRRFQHALFRKDDVMVCSAEGSGSVCIQLRLEGATRQEVFTLPFKCTDPVQWFAEHVLNMEFPNAKHAT